jgi:xanthine dehydrogenase accessory factor
MRDLLSELTAALYQGRDCVYCAVVETRGSTPQKAGAAMLVFPDGTQRGTLGGGCVEAEVKQRALRILSDGGQPEVLTFNLDDNYGWDDGLICGGRMSMLVEPIQTRPESSNGRSAALSAYCFRFQELVEAGRGCTEAVAIREDAGATVGSRYLFDQTGELTAHLGDSAPPATIKEYLLPLEKRPGPSSHHGVAYLPILPRITLVIVGGGHVGQAVGRLAAEADFDIWVLDDRETYASQERFPSARKRIVGDIGSSLKNVVQNSINASTYCIIVTRGHAHDEEALYHLVTSNAGYVGMIGSKRKIRMIYEDLIAKGIPAEALERVHAPLGFEIGSQTVPEIAISIVAELIAHRNLGNAKPAQRTPVRAGNVRS